MFGRRKKTAKISSLKIEEAKVPQVLILRGSSDLQSSCEKMHTFFTNVEAMGPADGNWQESFLGERNGIRCAYACVHNASMAAEAVHRFSRAGASLVLYTGCCAVKTRRIETGDLFIVTEAYRCKGISDDSAEIKCVPASYDGAELSALQAIRKVQVHWGRVYSTAMDYPVEEYLPPASFMPDCWAVDRETAVVFSTAKQFGIHRTAILYVRDNFLTAKHGEANADETGVRRRGYLHHLAVATSYRGRGIGAKLVARALKNLAQEGIRKCNTFSFDDNQAGLAFWNHLGWQQRDDIQILSRQIT